MSVIAVVNRKGGSGKSTLATHLAAWLAGQGLPTVLGDVDRQQSTHSWLRRRAQQPGAQQLRLVGWNVDPRNVVRPPTNSGHMVLDTPGGLRGFDLARVVMYADAILMPVCNSVFDRESAADCVAELRTLPRVASGRCRLAVVGMRIDARTKAEAVLASWASSIDLPFLGVLRDTQAYVRCIEDGLTLFDQPPAKVAQDLAQWQPIVDWLAPLVLPPAASSAPAAGPAAVRASEPAQAPAHALAAAASIADRAAHPPRTVISRPGSLPPSARQPDERAGQGATALAEPLIAVAAAPTGPSRAAGPNAAPSAAAARRPAAPPATAPRGATPVGRLLNALAIPRFLQRTS